VGIISILTVALGHASGALAKHFHTRQDKHVSGFQGDRTRAVTLFLRPLTVTLPIFGWILACHNLFGGVYTQHLVRAVKAEQATVLPSL
jgi:hypothetical protein